MSETDNSLLLSQTIQERVTKIHHTVKILLVFITVPSYTFAASVVTTSTVLTLFIRHSERHSAFTLPLQ